MTDENTQDETQAEERLPAPEALTVVAQDSKTVGDDDLEPRDAEVEVVKEQVDAQVSQPREAAADKVNVHEVTVTTDYVITDPSSPLAVQVPDAGRGSLDLPIHQLAGPTVEDVFASEAAKADDN